MLIYAVARQMPIIGLVYAHGEVSAGLQSGNGKICQPAVFSEKDANFPRTGRAALEPRCERMHRNDGAIRGCQLAVGFMIGTVILLQPTFHVRRVRIAIGRNEGAVVNLHQQGGIIFAAVGINHQS